LKGIAVYWLTITIHRNEMTPPSWEAACINSPDQFYFRDNAIPKASITGSNCLPIFPFGIPEGPDISA
jgi:hypothetical protein